jgi:hypothetical protein
MFARLLGINCTAKTSCRFCGACAIHEVYPYDESVTHGDFHAAHVAALSEYAETHERVELVSVSKLVTAA